MGEIADYYIDRELRGLEWDDEDAGEETITCKYCGLPGLMWQQTNKRWRLTDIRGIIHLCPERPMTAHAEALKATIKFPPFK